MKKHLNPRNLVLIALFGALAAILMLFEIPLTFIVPEFIKLDFSELPVVLGAFMMGPVEGIFIATVKVLLKLVLLVLMAFFTATTFVPVLKRRCRRYVSINYGRNTRQT